MWNLQWVLPGILGNGRNSAADICHGSGGNAGQDIGQHDDLDLCILLSVHEPMSAENQDYRHHVHAEKDGDAGTPEAKQECGGFVASVF